MQLAFRFVPSRESFLESLGSASGDVLKDLQAFIDAFGPILREVHQFLVSWGRQDAPHSSGSAIHPRTAPHTHTHNSTTHTHTHTAAAPPPPHTQAHAHTQTHKHTHD